ncbi:MAG TPA: hypothetical protein VFC78_18285 [Tepidisphaeraceae bacterium]|nr:hypothetical protein [Tepidisphaeraceae bacterium]
MDRSQRRNSSMRGTIATCGLVSLALLLAGCGWQQPRAVGESQYDPSQAAQVNVPPKQLMQIIAQRLPGPPLAIAIDTMNDGTILTGWKEYEGALHIVRHWQERTRFKITILPDFNDPTGKSHVQVIAETEEKPSAGQPWYPAPQDRRPQRAAQVLKVIEQASRQTPVTPATAPSQVHWTR